MEISDIVEAVSGRDQGARFFIINVEGEYLYLADGKGRTVEKPKKKKRRHVRFISECHMETAEKLRSGQKVLNSELRRALAIFAAASGSSEGGL